jgi:D-alanine-D-alanine ligase-like ATP-grasp enzyme
VHEGWRAIDANEFELAHKYTQRVIEDFYEHREAVVGVLTEKGRLEQATPPNEDAPSEDAT